MVDPNKKITSVQLHWKKLPEHRVANTIWDTSSSTDIVDLTATLNSVSLKSGKDRGTNDNKDNKNSRAGNNLNDHGLISDSDCDGDGDKDSDKNDGDGPNVIHEFEELFCAIPSKAPKAAGKGKAGDMGSGEKPKVTKFLYSQRANNISIVLSRFPKNMR